MKKVILLIISFIIYTIFVVTCPVITNWDKSVIMIIQDGFKSFPIYLALLPDCKLYSLMIVIPIVSGGIYFIKRKDFINTGLIFSLPLFAFLLNCCLKQLVHRVRPPFELQQLIHPSSYSYVSSHSLVTMSLYCLVIYYFYKYCSNKILKYSVIILSVLWILFVGISRIWLGVHFPTDVIGAYLLGFILFIIYSKIRI